MVGYGQDLPIVGVHAKLVAAAHPTQQAGVLLFPRLRLVDDDFQQEIMPGAPRPREEAAQLALVLFHDLGRILRTGAEQAFHHMVLRPRLKRRTHVGLALEHERVNPGLFNGTAHPERIAVALEQDGLAVRVVHENAHIVLTFKLRGGFRHGPESQILESGNGLGVAARFGGQRGEGLTVVKGEHGEVLPLVAAVGGPVDLFEHGVFAQPLMLAAVADEVLQLGPARIG